MAGLSIDALNSVLDRAICVVADSKEEIFRISEDARVEMERMQRQLAEIKQLISHTTREVESTEKRARSTRQQLAKVSRDFQQHNEAEIREAYEVANQIQVELMLLRQKEKELWQRREELQRAILTMEDLVKRAEELLGQIEMATKMLSGSWGQVDAKLQELDNWQQLGAKIIAAQEEERQRIARDLHDGPVQTLAGISLRTELCQRLLELDPPRLAPELGQLEQMVKTSTSDLRKIIFNLRPFALDDLGLVPALERMFQRLLQEDGLLVELVVHGEERRFNSTKEVAVYRIIQEALNNVHKHAEVNSALVKIEFLEKRLRVQITDYGRGFADETSDGGYGLLTMRERAELVGGSLSIYSRPKNGTTVELLLADEIEGLDMDGNFTIDCR